MIYSISELKQNVKYATVVNSIEWQGFHAQNSYYHSVFTDLTQE
jgi:hypothetical protein